MQIRIRKADKEYSKWLRQKRDYTCERCYKKYPQDRGLYGLHVSHFYGRAKESVRFDPENTDLLCFGCHQYFTSNPAEYTEWKKKKLGERFKILQIRANQIKKKDDKLILLWLKHENSYRNSGL